MLKNYWYIACESHELKSRPIARTVLDNRIVFFRDAQGIARAVLDRCPHRNMDLAGGTVTEYGLQCPYHGWTWDGEGRCTFIPAACAADREKTQAYKVASFPVAEKQGLVWIFIGENLISPHLNASTSASKNLNHPAFEPINFPFYDTKGWRHWFMQRTFEGNVFNCVENFLDCPHTVFVHKHLFRLATWKDVQCRVTSGLDWVEAEFLNEKPLTTVIGQILFPQNLAMFHTDRFILPGVTRVEYKFSSARHFVIMSQCTPVTETTTRVYTYMAFRFDPIAPLIRLLYEPYAHFVLDQDVRVIARQAKNIAAHGVAQFVFHSSDAIAREIRDLMDGKSLVSQPEYIKHLRF